MTARHDYRAFLELRQTYAKPLRIERTSDQPLPEGHVVLGSRTRPTRFCSEPGR